MGEIAEAAPLAHSEYQGSLIMVARIDNELLSQASLTPQPELSDSDDVLLALETARALETQGELREAARWLRRAADEAEQQGDDERVLVLARAAAEMANIVGSTPPGAEAPTIPPPSPDALDASDEKDTSSTPPPESLEPTLPTVPDVDAAADVSAPPTSTPPLPAPAPISSPPDTPFTERSLRIGAIRVAILEASIRGAKSFFVERLERGQLPPAGTTEAMLVFTGEESSDEQNVNLLAASDSILP